MAWREYFNNRVVNSYSCADPGGLCSGPSNLGIIFVLSIYHFELSCSAFLASFSSPLDALAVSSPFGTVSDTVSHSLIFSVVHYYLLEPCTLFSFSDSFTRLIPCLTFGRLGVYCILHTLAVSWEGLGYQFRALLYLYPFNPCGEVCCASSGNCVCSL